MNKKAVFLRTFFLCTQGIVFGDCQYGATCCDPDDGGLFNVDGTQAYCDLTVYVCVNSNGPFAYLVHPGPGDSNQWDNNDLGGLTDLCNANFAAAPLWGTPCPTEFSDTSCTWAVIDTFGNIQNQGWLQQQSCQGNCTGYLAYATNIHFNDCSGQKAGNCSVASEGKWYYPSPAPASPPNTYLLTHGLIGSQILQYQGLNRDDVWIGNEGPQPGATGNNIWAIFRALRGF